MHRLDEEDGIAPDHVYDLDYTVEFWSNEPANCPGIDRAAAEQVYIKVGGSTTEPTSSLEERENGEVYGMNIDTGEDSRDGKAASVAGNIANARVCDEVEAADLYALTTVTARRNAVQATEEGQFWLLVGADSSYEGATNLYIRTIDVTLLPSTDASD